jgi:nitroreductase
MNVRDVDPAAHRDAAHGVDPLFVRRWSPRAMSGEEIGEDELMRLFEAARWAPSSYNNQPWRFLWARRGSDAFDRFFDLLTEGNRSWCQRAAALVVVAARTTFERNGKPSRTHAFSAGAAWMSLALQGTLDGLVVHGMQGFDYDGAAAQLGVPEGFAVQAMIAIGRPGEIEDLPTDKLRDADRAPSGRKALDEIAFEGRWP